MNAIFLIFCTLALIITAVVSPSDVMPAMLGGIEKAVLLSVTLLSVYALWLGIFKIAELSGITKKLARSLRPVIKFLFGKTSEKTEEYISLNLSTNLFGMSGLATPLGIAACENLQRENNFFGAQMLFVIASTSIQVLPASVLALMVSAGSENPSRIILPSLLSTVVSTALGIILMKIFKPKTKPAENSQAEKTSVKKSSAKLKEKKQNAFFNRRTGKGGAKA